MKILAGILLPHRDVRDTRSADYEAATKLYVAAIGMCDAGALTHLVDILKQRKGPDHLAKRGAKSEVT